MVEKIVFIITLFMLSLVLAFTVAVVVEVTSKICLKIMSRR